MSWIEQEIAARGGEISFRDFMELALYHPQHGYYSGREPRYGRAADFLTAPTASRWYGSIVGGWCRRLAGQLGPLRVVDLAAGDGSFLNRLADRLAEQLAEVVSEVVAVERSPAMRALQRRQPRQAGVPWSVVGSLTEDLAAGPALVHASELYDALPVERVVQRGAALMELWVAATDHGLQWRERPAPAAYAEYFAAHGVLLADGQLAEINSAAPALHRSLLRRAGGEAVVVVLDYGYEARRLYNPRGRFEGSLSCYRRHQLSRDPLAAPGEQDVTAHVNWDDLRRVAAAAGFVEVGLYPLAEFLVRAGVESELARERLGMEAELDARTVSERQEIKRLLDPEGMGSDLKVLVQAGPAVAAVVSESLELP